MDSTPPPWHEVSRRTLHHGAKFDFEQLTLVAAGDDGRTLTREVVRHPGAVVILPVLDAGPKGRVVMIRNWRHTLGRWLLEFPAGTLEPGEAPPACAARELVEETGYRAATLSSLGRFHTTPGLTDELMWAYAASGLVPIGQRLEADERIDVKIVSRSEAWELIDRGELQDAKSLAAWMLAERRGLLA
jgi:ADP-ribose pyrophosphatase